MADRGPYRRDFNKLGHKLVAFVAVLLAVPILWHVFSNWGI